MISRIALALAVAMVSTSATAQTTKDDYKWLRDMTKTQDMKTIDPNAPPPPAAPAQTLDDPYKYYRDMVKTQEMKTNPDVPVAPSEPTAGQSGQFTRTPLPAASNNSILDGCVIAAIGRLPKAEGLRVTDSSYEYRSSYRKFEFWNVRILAELNGRHGSYQWICRVYDNVSAQLIENR